MLLAGIGWLVWYYASRETEMVSDDVPNDDPLIGAQISPSQKRLSSIFSSSRCCSFCKSSWEC
jgi:hypothetical protein